MVSHGVRTKLSGGEHVSIFGHAFVAFRHDRQML
jgi:hypothetical protein